MPDSPPTEATTREAKPQTLNWAMPLEAVDWSGLERSDVHVHYLRDWADVELLENKSRFAFDLKGQPLTPRSFGWSIRNVAAAPSPENPAFVPSPGEPEHRKSERDRRGVLRSVAMQDIAVERFAQNEQWGGEEHDDTHGAGEWVGYILHQLRKLGIGIPDAVHVLQEKAARRRLIKIAALCIAAAESMDRRSATPASPPTPHERAIEAKPTPEDWSKLTTPKKREVTLWNSPANPASAACEVRYEQTVAWICANGEVRKIYNPADLSYVPNAWPLPAGTGERLDAYFDSLEPAPARPDSGEGEQRWTQDDLRDVALRVRSGPYQRWEFIVRVDDRSLKTSEGRFWPFSGFGTSLQIQLIDGRIVGPTKPKDWFPCVRDAQRAASEFL